MNDGFTTINLAPADLRKEGPGFDLPIAISLIAHRTKIPIQVLAETSMIGELALNGELRAVRGVLAVALEARARGRRRLLVPRAQAAEASVVAGIDNYQIARVARLAGAPKVQGAGVDLLCKLGDTVACGQMLYRVHASYPADLEFARQACLRDTGYTIGVAADVPSVFVEF